VGASSGLGMRVAQHLLDEGWMVGAAARRDCGDVLHAPSSRQLVTALIDVQSPTADTQLQTLIGRLGGLDLYFHAAGTGKTNRELEPSIELGTTATNAMGFVRLVGAAFRHMAANGGGHIAVISSIAGTKGLGRAPSYSATKAMQAIYIEALEQLARTRHLDIRFTDIRPGFVDTPLIKDGHYPMTMRPDRVARSIMSAIRHRRHVCTIDYRWRVVVALWRLIPHWLWRRLPL